jgi:hypothetical protein
VVGLLYPQNVYLFEGGCPWVVAPCRLHGSTTQKTAIFIVTALRTSSHMHTYLSVNGCLNSPRRAKKKYENLSQEIGVSTET